MPFWSAPATHPGHPLGDLAVHVRHRLAHALAVPALAAVHQLDRLELARGRAGGLHRARGRRTRATPPPPPSGCRASSRISRARTSRIALAATARRSAIFRIDPQLARQRHDREQQLADHRVQLRGPVVGVRRSDLAGSRDPLQRAGSMPISMVARRLRANVSAGRPSAGSPPPPSRSLIASQFCFTSEGVVASISRSTSTRSPKIWCRRTSFSRVPAATSARSTASALLGRRPGSRPGTARRRARPAASRHPPSGPLASS